MGKKKTKPNAFSEFMFEFINKERKMGRHHVKEQWSSVAKPHWEKLSQEQKEHYKVRAKGKSSSVYPVPQKYTSQGVAIEEIEREQKELAEKKKYMDLTIKNWVENGQLSQDLVTKPIIFMMANYFYKTHELVYSPAEIAVSKFTIKQGLLKSYHTFVDPQTVQVGYAFEAKDRYERIHRLAPPPDAIGESNYDNIFASILDILGIKLTDRYPQGDERRPMVFIRKEDIPMIESILDQFAYDNPWRQMFDLFELEVLFNELKNAAEFDLNNPSRPKIPMAVSSYFIEQDRFDLTPGISCDHHEEADASKICALSYTRRWFYIIADHVAVKMNVKMEVRTHIPENLALIASNLADDVWEDEEATSSNRNRETVDISQAPYKESYHIGYGQLEDSSTDSDDD